MKERYSEEHVHKKIAEFINIKHRCQRYWKKLSKVSLKIVKEKGLKLEFLDLNNLPEKVLFCSSSNEVPVYIDKNHVGDEILLKFSKQELPSLYRRFSENYTKYLELEKEMKYILEHLPN